MLDATPAQLTDYGAVTVSADGVAVVNFGGRATSCRDMAALAIVWAIGRLQAELLEVLQKPGGGNITVE